MLTKILTNMEVGDKKERSKILYMEMTYKAFTKYCFPYAGKRKIPYHITCQKESKEIHSMINCIFILLTQKHDGCNRWWAQISDLIAVGFPLFPQGLKFCELMLQTISSWIIGNITDIYTSYIEYARLSVNQTNMIVFKATTCIFI